MFILYFFASAGRVCYAIWMIINVIKVIYPRKNSWWKEAHKNSKSSGITGEMMKYWCCYEGTLWLSFCPKTIFVLDNWKNAGIVPVYKEKGSIRDCKKEDRYVLCLECWNRILTGKIEREQRVRFGEVHCRVWGPALFSPRDHSEP